jgi:hypothetical protein
VPALTADPQTVSPGGTTTVTGTGFPAGSPALVQLFSDPVTLGTATVDTAGRFRIVVTIPLVTAPGVHTLVATGPGGSPRAQAPLTVAAPAGVLGLVSQVVRPLLAPALLARTGSATDEAGRLALLLMVAGGLLVVAEGCASPSRAGPFPFRSRRSRWPRRR